MNLLEVQHVSKQFEGHLALNDVSFHVPKGTIVGLVGHNGAGKTTLIRIITQITAADRGHIFLDGSPIQTNHLSRIGYLPEERGLYKKMKVLEQLVYLGRLRGLSRTQSAERAKSWLQRLELEAWSTSILADLSKGMQQKVQFIAAVLHEPDFLILDEPFSGFDPLNADLFTREILRLNKQGTTIMFSTHQMESIDSLCQHLVMINKSTCVYSGTVEDLKEKYATSLIEIEGVGQAPTGVPFVELQQLEHHFIGCLTNDQEPVDLLNKYFQHVKVTSFRHKSLSMRELFLTMVTEKSDA